MGFPLKPAPIYYPVQWDGLSSGYAVPCSPMQLLMEKYQGEYIILSVSLAKTEFFQIKAAWGSDHVFSLVLGWFPPLLVSYEHLYFSIMLYEKKRKNRTDKK